MLSYARGFIVLFVLLALLLYLPPGKSYQKYIRFFAQLLLVLSILSPILSFFGGEGEFMDRVEYQEFTENLSELSRDTDKIAYMHNDYYTEKYEQVIAENVQRTAGEMLKEYGLCAKEATVQMTDDYTIEEIGIQIAEGEEGDITVGEILLSGEENGDENAAVYAGLKQQLADFYQIDEEKIRIGYAKAGQEEACRQN